MGWKFVRPMTGHGCWESGQTEKTQLFPPTRQFANGEHETLQEPIRLRRQRHPKAPNPAGPCTPSPPPSCARPMLATSEWLGAPRTYAVVHAGTAARHPARAVIPQPWPCKSRECVRGLPPCRPTILHSLTTPAAPGNPANPFRVYRCPAEACCPADTCYRLHTCYSRTHGTHACTHGTLP
jgi:hypothetical protein